MDKRELMHDIKYGTIKPQMTDKCPKCGGIAYANVIDVGVGYYYEPLHCECGWSEMWFKEEIFKYNNKCKKCCMACELQGKCKDNCIKNHYRVWCDICKQDKK